MGPVPELKWGSDLSPFPLIRAFNSGITSVQSSPTSAQPSLPNFDPPINPYTVNDVFFLSETKKIILMKEQIQERKKRQEKEKKTKGRMRGPSYTN